jgi:predicted RNA binding protein YcfA (HicA-like mRNA interferase family)
MREEMKYSELERKLKKEGCYEDGVINGHPAWYSPKTGKFFRMSHHKSREVAPGTLKSISKDSGVKF